MVIMTVIALCIVIATVTFLFLARPRFIHDNGEKKLIVGLPQLGRKPRGHCLERCGQSPQWRDGEFHNEHDVPATMSSVGKSKFKLIKGFLLSKHPTTRPPESRPAIRTDLAALPAGKDLIVWFGHSSFLMHLGGKKILVDPVFHAAAPVNFLIKPFAGTNVYKTANLPAIDLLIITHNHYDHLDYETVRKLRQRVGHVVCPLGVGESLLSWGYPYSKITELDWWQETLLPDGTSVRCTPSRHFSGRTLRDSNKSLWGSFVVVKGDRRIFISGDGGYDTHFRRIGEQYGPFDVAFMENGQYDEMWSHVHTMPQEMPQECKDINARRIFSVHHGKFAMAYHPWDEPYRNIETLREAGLDVMPNEIGRVVEF